jgi:hypothetical protein
MLSDRAVIELFHLHFVRVLCTGPDRESFAIKGGCNLRFFFESVRYSEDIDLDVTRLPVHKLKDKLDKIFAGPSLTLPLRSRGIAVSAVTAPKQTETTQRWKVALRAESHSLDLHTKIEFSRRPAGEEAKVEPVSAGLLSTYQLMPLLAPHYLLAVALRQKVSALVGRSAVQARDVFDLAVLFAKAGGRVESLRPIRASIPKAVERAMEISYADYKSQVVSYLIPEQVDAHGSRQSWDAIQSSVVDALERALP